MSFKLVLAAGFVPFAAFLLFAAVRMPMSFDDAFNATMPLSLARGSGYATSLVGVRPFNPSISSGAAFLAPAALPIAAFGAEMHWPMLYTASICLTLYLFLLRSLQTHSPHAALATSLLTPFMLWQGKNDPLVAGNILPPPPFGYWYQLLGNLPGVLALALAMSLLLEPAPSTAKRWIAIVVLIVFGVNAKIMHILSLVAMVAMWAALPAEEHGLTRTWLRRLGPALGLIAAGWLGLRLNRVLAWASLNAETFQTFLRNETALLSDQIPAANVLQVPSPTLLISVVKSIVWNGLRAVPFLGGTLQAPMTLAFLVTTALAARRAARDSSLARLALVLLAGVLAHFAWWVCMPSPPFRHLTAVAPLTCFVVGCGLGLSWMRSRQSAEDTRRRHGILWGTSVALLCVAGVPNLVAAFNGWKELRDHRNAQLSAAVALERLADRYPDAAFCLSGWYAPRELTYLAPASIKWCSLHAVRPNTPGRRILMRATHIWPQRDDMRIAIERCPSPIEQVGRFEFRPCDGFHP